MSTLAADEALLCAVLRTLGHREWGHGTTRPWMRARLREHVRSLAMTDAAYLDHLAADLGARRAAALAVACAMSRFHRGGRVLAGIRRHVLPELASNNGGARVWSAGAARGEEAYTVAMLWLEMPPPADRKLDILASDIRADSLAAGQAGVFSRDSVKEVPADSLARWFEPLGDGYRLRDEPRRLVRFELHDLEHDAWPREIDLLLLRTICFTYWDEPLRRVAAERAHTSLRSGGYLAIGRHEELPSGFEASFERVEPEVNLFRKVP